MRMRVLVFALIAAGWAVPAVAEDPAPSLEGAQQQAVEGLSKLLDALGMFVKSVPQFAAPEVLPNGDIIIRRIHPDRTPSPPARPKSDDDGTST